MERMRKRLGDRSQEFIHNVYDAVGELSIPINLQSRVSDLYSFFTDPDPVFEMNKDPDPAF